MSKFRVRGLGLSVASGVCVLVVQDAGHRVQENDLEEPRTDEEYSHIWGLLCQLPSFQNKGPLCKLMRWFSFNDAAKEYYGGIALNGRICGQLWAIKMVMEYHLATVPAEEEDDAPPVVLPTRGSDALDELRKLKAQSGQLRLTPKIITEENIWVLDMIMQVTEPSWNTHGSKAKQVRCVAHAVADALEDHKGAWQAELVALVARCLHGSNDRICFHKLGLLKCSDDEATDKTAKLVDIVLLIIHHRGKSGARLTSLMPHRTV